MSEFWLSYGPWIKNVLSPLCFHYRKLSGQLLRNYWCNFIQTLQEWSVPSLVVHIVGIFWFVDFSQSYGPLMIFIFKVCPDYFSYTTEAIWMKLYRIDRYLKYLRIFNGFSGWMIFGGVMALEWKRCFCQLMIFVSPATKY